MIASPSRTLTAEESDPMRDVSGIAIWASVDASVDQKIREQISASVFPIRLAPEEWNSGEINWILDVISPDRDSATKVVRNFKQVAGQGELRLHPSVAKQLDQASLDSLTANVASAANNAATKAS